MTRYLFAALVWAVVLSVAHAHEAPSGWQYDMACCSDQDCRPLTAEEVGTIRQTPAGYQATIEGFAEPIIFPSDKIKPSKDQYFHGCVGLSGIGYCLYIPMGV